jgi:hypothetical protein
MKKTLKLVSNQESIRFYLFLIFFFTNLFHLAWHKL